MKPVLHVDGISTRRDGVPILSDVNWTVRRNEHWVILGANGSGKSSLLSALTGYFPPTSGSIRVLGREFGATDWRDLRKRIGIVAASIGLQMHDEDTVLDIVCGGDQAMIGTWGRVDAAVLQRAKRMLLEFDLVAQAGRRWEVLSQGERQRVLIARAMMTRPKLLILDEPCAGLDPVARRQFLKLMQTPPQKHRAPSIVLVTHHIEEITPAFTHALLMRAGSVITSGEVRQMLTSRNLSAVFDAPMVVRRKGDAYLLADESAAGES